MSSFKKPFYCLNLLTQKYVVKIIIIMQAKIINWKAKVISLLIKRLLFYLKKKYKNYFKKYFKYHYNGE